METVCSSKTQVSACKSIWHYNQENRNQLFLLWLVFQYMCYVIHLNCPKKCVTQVHPFTFVILTEFLNHKSFSRIYANQPSAWWDVFIVFFVFNAYNSFLVACSGLCWKSVVYKWSIVRCTNSRGRHVPSAEVVLRTILAYKTTAFLEGHLLTM